MDLLVDPPKRAQKAYNRLRSFFERESLKFELCKHRIFKVTFGDLTGFH
jgi:hypothetical protein